MTLPAGITLCTVTLGYDTSWLGNDAVISGNINADRTVIWQATGTRISNGNDSVPNTSGQLVFQVPHVDQNGFIDQAGNVVKNWFYTLNASVSKNGVTESIRRNFQVFVGQTTVDLDLVADGPTQPGFTAPSASVNSVQGRTGTVDLTDLFVPRPSGGTDGQAILKSGTGFVFGAAGGGASLARTSVKNSAYTAAANDLVPVDASAGSVTITLPTAPLDKAMVAVKTILLTTPNTVTVACGSGDTFNRTNGATSMTFSLLAQGANYQYDAAAKVWTVSEYAPPLSQLDNRFGHAIYDVRSYGAVLDNTADDSTAVQAAIDACSAAGGGVVYIPAQATGQTKACKVNTPIVLKSGVWLRGAGATSVITGTANPMITMPSSGTVVDRIAVTDLFLQGPAGVGVKLDSTGTTGGYQLGWPRITVENVTVTDAASHAFQIALSGIIETRFINCVSLRSGGHGFSLSGTDLFILDCTAAAGTNAAFDGFFVSGANNKVTGCKGYGNLGNGFLLAGAGRHVVSGCESQDNVKSGYSVTGSYNTIVGCLADSDKIASYNISGSNNLVDGVTAMAGGGGSGQTAPVGVLLTGTANRVGSLLSNLATKVGGTLLDGGNTVDVTQGGTKNLPYAATITPDPYAGDSVEILLTGNATIAAPTTFHRGQRLTFLLKQDATGGRVATFAGSYVTSWTPNTAANKLNVITFRHDGTAWTQESATTGLDRPTPIADDFNRADNNATLGSTSVGSLPWTNRIGVTGIVSNQAAPITLTGGNAIATVDTGRSSGRIRFTFSTVVGIGGIVFRYVDANNYLYTFGGQVAGRIGGVNRDYASGLGVPLTSGDIYEIVMSGTSVTYIRNGVNVWSGVINDLPAGTSHGLINASTSNRMDDFSFA